MRSESESDDYGTGMKHRDPPRDLTVSQWEKKAELAMLEGRVGEAMKYAHYANVAEVDS